MTSSTLEHERNKPAGAATISGPLGAHPAGTRLGPAAGGVSADALLGMVGREGAVTGDVVGNKIAES